MPIKNREWALPYVLKSIENQDYPKKFIKIVFVDNYSTDKTYTIVAEWIQKMKNHYYDVILTRETGNIPRLRNKCVSLAEGKYLVFWDSDMIAPRFIVRRMVELAELKKDVGIIVATFKYADIDYIPVMESLEDRQLEFKETIGAGTGFTLIKLEIFKQIGGFNEELGVGEDTEFSYRVHEKTCYKTFRVDTEVLHLKHRDRILIRANQSFIEWLHYNFYQRSEEYLRIYNLLPKYLKIRVIYWLLLPLITSCSILALILLNCNILKSFIITLLFLYISLSVYLSIKSLGFRKGLRTWVAFNLPTGLALSYGMLRIAIEKFSKSMIRIFQKGDLD
jgi:glycosyltransferase involved in cell wall biosynthesis